MAMRIVRLILLALTMAVLAAPANANYPNGRLLSSTGLRRAYVEAGGLGADELISDIEAAIGRRAGAPRHQADHGGADKAAAEFAWRTAPEAPRFVAQSFEAAPPVFRAGTQAPSRKNFFGGGGKNADPKQSPGAPDAPPWLNH